MKALRLLRWSGAVLSPRTRPCCFIHQNRYQIPLPFKLLRCQSTAVAPSEEPQETEDNLQELLDPRPPEPTIEDLLRKSSDRGRTESILRSLPSPPPSQAHKSARLSALHARLMLPPRLPLESLARCLVDPSADINPHFNNSSFSLLGSDLLGLYTSEAILCRYPRLPTEVMFAAMYGYCGPKTLTSITREWGVDIAAAPGGEVDPGFLQCKRVEAGNASVDGTGTQIKELHKIADPPNQKPTLGERGWRRGVSARTVKDDYFGDEIKRTELDYAERPELYLEDQQRKFEKGVTVEDASSNFVRALIGAIHLHAGKKAAYNFFKAHILSRHLDVSSLFEFRQPTRDLSRLCAREGFESPVARILSETGRKSRTPVFVVGVFAGKDKLGEGSGSSLDEARIRAAIGALKGWYLYSPLEVRLPSQAEKGKEWEPVLVDGGEVVV